MRYWEILCSAKYTSDTEFCAQFNWIGIVFIVTRFGYNENEAFLCRVRLGHVSYVLYSFGHIHIIILLINV